MNLDNTMDDNDGLFTNKSVMMANFEEWIKLATDNKINSRNSWNFALIDYFYDLNILRDSQNNINFQKASATLDGCIKIYSSRVDSVSNETGKLLSGLAQPVDSNNNNSSTNTNNNSSTGNNNKNNNTGNKDSNDEGNYSIEIDPTTGLPRVNTLNDDEPLQRRKNYNRVLETTLVPFESIKIKELDQELNIDPLFKKALVDFDEGGSKNLLLNTLNINKEGRVIFDTSIKDNVVSKGANVDNLSGNDSESDENEDEILDGSSIINKTNEADVETDKSLQNNTLTSITNDDTTMNINDEILSLGMDLLKFDKLSTSELSSSLKQLRLLSEDVNKEKIFIDSVNNKFDNFLTEQELADIQPATNIPDIDNDEIPELGYSMGEISNGMDGLDENNNDKDVNINEFDINSKHLDENNISSSFNHTNNNNLSMDLDDNNNESHMDDTTTGSILEQDLMAYFDEALRKNWRGREHWKVLSVKKNLLNINTGTKEIKKESGNGIDKPNSSSADGAENNEETSDIPDKKAKKKKATEINFFEIDDDLEDKIFTTSTKDQSKQPLELAQKLRVDDSHYLLPNDYHFTSERVISLFIKPEQKMSLFKKKRKTNTQHPSSNFNSRFGFNNENDPNTNVNKDAPEIANEEFWANEYELQELDQNPDVTEGNSIVGQEVENPFADDDDIVNGIDFNQAFDDGDMVGNPIQTQSLGIDNKEDIKPLFKDTKVNYSRVSKKVDVRRLKSNVWKSISSLLALKLPQVNSEDTANDEITLSFTDVIGQLTDFYPAELYKDISTSFCFICLLHLANEHGFYIKDEHNFEDLTIIFNKGAQQSIPA